MVRTLAATAALVAGNLCLPAWSAPILWIDDSSGRIGTVDVATGVVTAIGNAGQSLTDIAFDPNRNLYGITFGNLYTIDQTTGVATQVGTGSFPSGLNGLTFAANGTLYASGDNHLFTIDTTTGVATLVGDSGLASGGSAGDLAFHNGVLYETVTDGLVSDLVSVDTTTGAATSIGQIVADANVYGLVNGGNNVLYGIDGTNIYALNTTTGAGTLTQAYTSASLGQAFGAAARSEAAAVPEPASIALFGVGALALALRRGRSRRDLPTHEG